MRVLLPALLAALVAVSCGSDVTAAAGPALQDLDGEVRTPLDVPAGGLHVVVFTSTDCPIANAYAPELQAIQAEFAAAGVAFFHVQVDPRLTAETARAHALEYAYGEDTCFLLDPDHRLVEALGARITPEVFVLDEGGRVAYRGRIDDQFGEVGKKRPRASRRELRDVLEQHRTGAAITVVPAPAVGCFIE